MVVLGIRDGATVYVMVAMVFGWFLRCFVKPGPSVMHARVMWQVYVVFRVDPSTQIYAATEFGAWGLFVHIIT
jgi:hypothetical protein